MFSSPSFARELRHGEEKQVDQLLTRAFPGHVESQLVHKLRKSKAIAGETVLPLDDKIIGYYALSHMTQPKGWLCLAPVAVDPDMQRQGFGKRMIGILSEWARLANVPVVVVGYPEFYEKAGFSRSLAANLKSPYPWDQTLLSGVKDASARTLIYPTAFDGM